MDYKSLITQEAQERQAITAWADRRREVLHQVTELYNTRGQSFARELEQLLAKYESAPRLNAIEVINELTKKI